MMDISHEYDDIIGLPRPVSETHPRMPMLDRAAQFSPFAALTGYDAAITETARLTEDKRELTEEQKQIISQSLSELQGRLKTDPEVTVVYFEPDARKTGGSYRTVSGNGAGTLCRFPTPCFFCSRCGRIQASHSHSLTCFMLREIRFFFSSTPSTTTFTVSPTLTTSLGCFTKRSQSSEICTRPS